MCDVSGAPGADPAAQRPVRSPYTPASLARLAASCSARELADTAARLVPIAPGELRPTGSGGTAGDRVADLVRLVAAAEYLLERWVVYEVLGGTTWPAIGEALGITKQSAHKRYGAAVTRFREALADPGSATEWPTGDGFRHARLPDGADDPDYWAPRLDAWVHRHQEPGDLEHGEHPVSGGMARLDPTVELIQLHTERARLLRQHWTVPAERLLPLAERELELKIYLAATQPGGPTAEDQVSIERTRLSIAELSEQVRLQQRAESAEDGARRTPGTRTAAAQDADTDARRDEPEEQR